MPSHPLRLPTLSVRCRVLVAAMAAIGAAVAVIGHAEAATVAVSAPTITDASVIPTGWLEARERTERARAAFDALKRATQPGHLLDPLPEGGSTLAIEDLRGQYSALQLKVATLATTLGDHHPDLVAAQQALADLRNQLSTTVKAAAVAAEHDVGDALAAQSALDRHLAGRDRDVTGSIGRSPASADPPSRGLVADAVGREVSRAAVPSHDAVEQTSGLTLMPDAVNDPLMMAPAALVLGAVAAAVALVALLTPRRPRPIGARRLIGRPATPAPAPDSQPNVPVLATVALPALAGASDLVSWLEREPDGAASSRIAEVIRRAAEAAGLESRMTVLVTPLSLSAEVEALAASIAVADSAAGRRTLLMDARPEGRLRETLMGGSPAAAVLAFGPIVRPAYEVRVGATTFALLPSDPDEREAVRHALARPGSLQRQGLSGFDTVVVLGQGIEADAGTLVSGADLVLIAAQEGTSPVELAAASEVLAAATARPCGAIIWRPERESRLAMPQGAIEPAGASEIDNAAPRAGRGPIRRGADRGGFRGTFDPSRDRMTA